MASSMAKEARNASTEGNRTFSNRGSKKDEYSSSQKSEIETEGRAAKKELLCDGGG